MNEIKNKPTQDGFIDGLIAAAADNPKIIVFAADLSRPCGTDKFKELYPDRFFNIGIAEQDMVGISTGFASRGKIPVVCTFASFLTGNAFAQIRLHVGLSRLNIKLVGFAAGVATGPDGATHQAIDDIALMRTIGCSIMQPSSYFLAFCVAKKMLSEPTPCYIRLSRAENQYINLSPSDIFDRAHVIKEGIDVTILATGALVDEAYRAGRELQRNGIDAEIINIIQLHPLDEQKILASIKKTGAVITCEDHSTINGLGSIIEDLLCREYPLQLTKIGIFPGNIGKSGTKEQLYQLFKLDSCSIVDAALDVIEQKKKIEKNMTMKAKK